MPVYVYKNLKTGATFEVEQRITEEALSSDPVTGDPVKRVIQPVGIAFKGSGFYVNDSRGSKSTASPAKAAKEGGALEGKAGASEGKAAAATAAADTPASKPAAESSKPAAGSSASA